MALQAWLVFQVCAQAQDHARLRTTDGSAPSDALLNNYHALHHIAARLLGHKQSRWA